MAFNLTGTIRERMITELFIPQVRKSMVADAFVTTKTAVDAESIKVWGIGSVTVGDYTGGDVAGVDHVDTSVLLTLDEAKYFKERVEKIDNEQSALDILPAILTQGGYEIGQAIDGDVFTALATTTSIVPTIALDASNVVSFIGSMSVKLTNAGAPRLGRALALTPEIVALLAEANITLNTTTAEEATKEGFIGRFYGFDIYETTNLPAGATGTEVIASVARGGALGLGFNELAIEDVTGQFYTVAKGLTNYGVKLVKDAYVAKCDATLA